MIVCFFFPWFEVSCGSIGFEFTGFQLAKGSYEGSLISMEAIQDFLNSLESRNQGAQWWLFSVPAACVLGIVSQLLGLSRIPLFCSFVCVGLPLGEYVYLRNQIPPEVTLILQLETQSGFWIVVVLGLLNAINVTAFPAQQLAQRRSTQAQKGEFTLDPVLPSPMPSPRKGLKEQAKDIRKSIRESD